MLAALTALAFIVLLGFIIFVGALIIGVISETLKIIKERRRLKDVNKTTKNR